MALSTFPTLLLYVLLPRGAFGSGSEDAILYSPVAMD